MNGSMQALWRGAPVDLHCKLSIVPVGCGQQGRLKGFRYERGDCIM